MPPAPFAVAMLAAAPLVLPAAGPPSVITLGYVAWPTPSLTPALREVLDWPETLSLISAPERSESLVL